MDRCFLSACYRNPEYDAVVEKISPLSVDDPKTLDYFTQAMDLWFKDLPMIYVSQLIIRYPITLGAELLDVDAVSEDTPERRAPLPLPRRDPRQMTRRDRRVRARG